MLHLYVSLKNRLEGIKTAIREDETGATAVEYGLMVALIAVAVVVVVGFLGTDVDWAFEQIESRINNDQN